MNINREEKLLSGCCDSSCSRRFSGGPKTGGWSPHPTHANPHLHTVPTLCPSTCYGRCLARPHGHCHCPDFAEVKAHVVLMVVRSDPAHPHTAGLLACEDPHRVIVLGTQREDQRSVRKMALLGTLNPPSGFWEFNMKLLNERSLETVCVGIAIQILLDWGMDSLGIFGGTPTTESLFRLQQNNK